MFASTVMVSDIAAAIPAARPTIVGSDRRVADVFHDSRDVTADSAFVAVRGAIVDGHDHVAAACNAGASVVIVDHELSTECTQLIVADTRACMADVAAKVHGYPATAMKMVGVTGTNGKTTVTHMIESIVAAAGGTAGIVGTVGAHIAGEVVPLARTTPEATDLHRLLRRMVERGVTVAGLEVSSHALVYGRADAIVFDVAVFTNLSQDHLDFHHTMEEYFAAKAALFVPERARHAVVWVDDPAGARIASTTSLATTTVGFGGAGTHDVAGEIEGLEPAASSLTVHFGTAAHVVRVPLAGRFNAANALVAAAAAAQVGIAPEAIVSGLEALPAVPGRFEQVPNDFGLTVIVDYAHTPDAVAVAVATAAEMATGRIIAVVGSAGDRDPAKREPMGAAAATADIAIITSDNPRSEDPAMLVEKVVVGAGGRSDTVFAEVDRRVAIRRALAMAAPGDLVLILGKGHENYQQYADRTIEFDDKAVAAAEMAVLRGEV